MNKKKLVFVLGTRPEAVKMAPLIIEANKAENINVDVILTGQHPEMAGEVLGWFEIVANTQHVIDRTKGSLNDILSQMVGNISESLRSSSPDAVVVQGDTASAFAGALVAFNFEIPVFHLEAGLRTQNIDSPFPEEGYRQMISRISSVHLCPTPQNKMNLLAEGVPEHSIMVTGNTIVDAFKEISSLSQNQELGGIDFGQNFLGQTVLVTAHRRENIPRGIVEISRALGKLASSNEEWNFIFALHPNPLVRAEVIPILNGFPNVQLVEPLDYPSFIRAMQRSTFLITDSGGVQEEGLVLKKPVLVARQNTERPEGITAGGAILVGTVADDIYLAAEELIHSPSKIETMAKSPNPYGDGHASSRAISAILKYFGMAQRVEEFNGTGEL